MHEIKDIHTDKKQKTQYGNSLALQWVGLHTSTAEGPGSIPGWGTKIPHAHGQIGAGKEEGLLAWFKAL